MRPMHARAVTQGVLLAGLLALSGCQGADLGWWSWFDPSRTVRTPSASTVNPIFSQIGATDQTTELVPNATTPQPEDLVYVEEDYVIGPSDVLRVEVLDLLMEGQQYVAERQVGDAGYIDLPLLPERVKANDLTSDQLAEEIKAAYVKANVLNPPVVASVTVVVKRQSIFSTVGAVGRPGTYPIPQKKFTLLEALAMAGDVSQGSIDYVYVIRPIGRRGVQKAPTGPERLPSLETLPEVPPTTTTAPTTRGAPTPEVWRELERYIPGAAVQLPRPSAPAIVDPLLLSAMGLEQTPASQSVTVPSDLRGAADMDRWVYSNGQWIRVRPQPEGGPETRAVAPTAPPEDPFGWREFDMSHTARIIAINLPKLKAAEQRMNIIIRNGDIIHVPMLEVGEFYVMGEVARPGAYSLTGRQVTLKMAVAVAGNLGPLSWPANTVLYRRVGRNQEQMVAIDLNKVISGEQPDYYLKRDDVVAVGSHWSAPFLAVWRNAFRMTYGFGFIYDRNYSERDFEIPLLAPSSGGRFLRH